MDFRLHHLLMASMNRRNYYSKKNLIQCSFGNVAVVLRLTRKNVKLSFKAITLRHKHLLYARIKAINVYHHYST